MPDDGPSFSKIEVTIVEFGVRSFGTRLQTAAKLRERLSETNHVHILSYKHPEMWAKQPRHKGRFMPGWIATCLVAPDLATTLGRTSMTLEDPTHFYHWKMK